MPEINLERELITTPPSPLPNYIFRGFFIPKITLISASIQFYIYILYNKRLKYIFLILFLRNKKKGFN